MQVIVTCTTMHAIEICTAKDVAHLFWPSAGTKITTWLVATHRKQCQLTLDALAFLVSLLTSALEWTDCGTVNMKWESELTSTSSGVFKVIALEGVPGLEVFPSP